MVNRNDANTARQTNALHKSDTDNLRTLATRQAHYVDAPPGDELILSLANALENKRARQVTEWEQLRRRSVHRSS